MTWPIWCCVASLYCLQKSMMFTPCWPSAVPTGGAGVACAAVIWSFASASTFFFGAISYLLRFERPRGLPLLDLRHLVEGELDRRLPVEDVDQHLQLGLVGVDLVDRAVEVCERAGRDLHHVLHRDVDAEDLVLHLHRVDPRLEVRLHLVLVARVRVDDVPVPMAPERVLGLPLLLWLGRWLGLRGGRDVGDGLVCFLGGLHRSRLGDVAVDRP